MRYNATAKSILDHVQTEGSHTQVSAHKMLFKLVQFKSYMNFFFRNFNRLLCKERPAMEINTVTHDWHEFYPEEIKSFTNIYDKKAIFPMHGMLKLKQRNRDVERKLWKHCDDLYDM